MLKRFTWIQPVWYIVTPLARRFQLWSFMGIDLVLTTWIMFEHPGYLPLLLIIKLPALTYQAQMAAVQTKDAFLTDFARFLSLFASTTSTGLSLRRSFDQTVEEYSASNMVFDRELQKLSRLLQYGTPLTAGLERLARHYALEEVSDLASQLVHAENLGHDMSVVLKRTSDWIGGHILHKQRLIRKMTEQVFEFRLTSKMPLLVLFLLNAVYPDYLSALYTSASGRGLMIAAVMVLEGSTVAFERTRLIQLKSKGLI